MLTRAAARRWPRLAEELAADIEFRQGGHLHVVETAEDRRAERQAFGLDSDLPTGLMMFGGSGSSAMLEIAERLEECSGQIQMISICGKNQQLAQALRSRSGRLRNYILGYTSEVQRYMHLSDFFIGKPGPGSLSEAVTMNLPVIVERNPRTMPQERYNVDWVVENDLGIVVSSFRGIVEAVKQIVSPATLARLRANAAKMDNRAIFEIPEILGSIVSNGSGAAP
jgi:1,2-diacylglycerol 3-beta-galactosyltransferase